jgi:hypothetical protein
MTFPKQFLDSMMLASQQWSGCDWETEFGPRGLNLRGTRSRQALLVAKATRGDEAQQWKEAAKWLAKVESDAEAAREFASRAAQAAASGDLAAASRHLAEAACLESHYPLPPHYKRCLDQCDAARGVGTDPEMAGAD